ncbi:MAG: WD40 repeat domain-containing protein, partial [Phyllobacteriaceae bacterium]|nr:WD40 repeat domain-containing protein [Phyllobacteriaceae bacterium]
MPAIDSRDFGSWVVATGFLGDTAAFALADGEVRLIDEAGERTVVAHDGGLLAARLGADGASLVSSGDDGRVVRTRLDGSVETLFEKKGKWLDQLAEGPQGAIATAAGRVAWVRLADGRVKE